MAATSPAMGGTKQTCAALPTVPTRADRAAVGVAEPTHNEISIGDDDGEPAQWPDAAAEMAFLAEQPAGGDDIPVPPSTPALRSEKTDAEAIEAANLPLPPLQTLVDRIPSGARDVLEELFRARFVSVKRVQRASFK